MARNTIFVYGTLKKGRGNHRLLETSKFLGKGETVEKYAMFASGIPFVKQDMKVHTIKGELYEVSDSTLRNLDGLEGHPNWYERRPVKVNVENEIIDTELYFYDDCSHLKLVENGEY